MNCEKIEMSQEEIDKHFSFENEIMATLINNIQIDMDNLVLEAINQIIDMFLEDKLVLSEVRDRITVGFGPGRSENVLFKNIVFLDKVPMIEVVLMKEDDKMFLKKCLVELV
jgi:hypothetical protein